MWNVVIHVQRVQFNICAKSRIRLHSSVSARRRLRPIELHL